jgi:hypothetical protein
LIDAKPRLFTTGVHPTQHWATLGGAYTGTFAGLRQGHSRNVNFAVKADILWPSCS